MFVNRIHVQNKQASLLKFMVHYNLMFNLQYGNPKSNDINGLNIQQVLALLIQSTIASSTVFILYGIESDSLSSFSFSL